MKNEIESTRKTKLKHKHTTIKAISQFHNHAQCVQAVCLAGNTSCKVDIFLKYDRNISIVIHFKQYVHSFIQSAMLRGCVARQTNCLYVLRMTVKLAYSLKMPHAPQTWTHDDKSHSSKMPETLLKSGHTTIKGISRQMPDAPETWTHNEKMNSA